jgi:hypothetical protein
LVLAIACILAATLTPAGTELQPEFSRCLVCGARGYSDALVNLILFAPLGATLALNGRSGARPVLAAGLLSCCVELAQIVIPGRDPSLGDVCFNTLGAAAGQALFFLGARWIVPTARAAARLSALAVIMACGVFALTGYLLAPSFPRLPYFAWWTADRPELAWVHGRVLQADLGPLSLHPSDRPLPPEVRSLLIAGTPLRIEAIAGPRLPSLGPLVSIEDRWRRDIVLVGPDRADLVLRYRARSAGLRLDGPDIRLRGVLGGVRRSDTLHITVQHAADGYCLGMNHVETCHLWFTIGTGWALLLYPKHFPLWAQHLLDAGWVAGLLVPLGLWMRRRPESMLAGGLVLWALSVLPGQAGLSPTPSREWVGAVCGVCIGLAVQVTARRQARLARGPTVPPPTG